MTRVRFLILLGVTILLTALLTVSTTVQVSAQLPREMLDRLYTGVRKPPMLERMLAGPMSHVEYIIFAIRIPGRDHWYANFGHYAAPHPDVNDLAWKEEDGLLWAYGEGTALIRQNIRTGELEVLLYDERGGIRNAQVHYDGKKILMSYRPGGTHYHHLYEIDIDGTNLRQLTDGNFDDIEPTYTPDGTIIFCSTRSKRFVACWHTPVATLFRMDADGQNIRMLSSSLEHDNTPWMLPDGRVLYTRWEYVDRSQLDYHHLWTMNPDGTQQVIYFGNKHPGGLMIGAKPIPGTDKVVATYAPGHGGIDHFGRLVMISPKKGPDDLGSMRFIGTGWFKSPYPFSEDAFLACNNDTIWIIDGNGHFEPLFHLPQELQDLDFAVREPRPVVPRPREAIIADRTDLTRSTGYIILQDTHLGRALHGLEPGTIRNLLVLRQLPKPVNFSGGMEPLTIDGSFTLSEILGTIPVAEDGSAFAELPALQSLFFVALDKNDIAVKRMHSFLTLQPGEVLSCIGCHEERIETPSSGIRASSLQATRHAPARPLPIPGVPSIIDFPRDVQPIFDRHCISCHSPGVYAGRLDLTGDKTAMHSMSYMRLTLHGQWVVDNRNRPMSNFRPYEMGSGASTLLHYLEPEHHGVDLTQEEKNVIRLWIDTSATYPGTYASLRSGFYWPVINTVPLLQRCGECHASEDTRAGRVQPWMGWNFPGHHWEWGGTAVNLSNPELSFLLRAPLAKEAGGLGLCSRIVFESTDDPVYQETLRAIQRTHRQLMEGKRFGMPGFRPNNDYIREMQRYGFVRKDLGPYELFDYRQAEREYFDSFFFDPSIGDIRSAAIP